MKNFIERWLNRGDEKSDTQKFWLEFLEKICGVDNPGEIIEFEKRVSLEDEQKGFIDAYIPSTRVIIEQKSINIQLDSLAYASILTPFEQAKRYSDWLPDSERARWIITCNFREFQIHDMEQPKAEPEIISLENLEREYRKFLFLVDSKAASPKEIHEEEISIKAGQLVGKLYDALIERYVNPNDKESQRSLNIFCVRVVFLLYAEDSGLFEKSQFHDYLKSRELVARDSLRKLFDILNQKIHERDPYLEADLKNFPFVNGGLFSEKNIELPQLDGEPLRIILEEMSEGFDWSKISPTIFGAVFESTLNPETRHSGGMHYTSIENIHKVIDPLFLENLKAELAKILKSRSKQRTKKLLEFQENLAKLKFLDPACGSGNFLTETYLCLRRLENQILSQLTKQQINFATGTLSPIHVKISQFFGIEINDFAVAVAKTALWIAEAQMWNETKKIVQNLDDFLPLENYENIHEANALTLDWQNVIRPEDLNFIMGNPPFVGASLMTKKQKAEAVAIFGKVPRANSIDYVGAWYHKAAKFIQSTDIHVAFVSTNSITQGEQVAPLWKKLFDDYKIHINFAWRTFRWDSEAKEKAHVHCVIVGFGYEKNPGGVIFDGDRVIEARNINAYLIDAPDVFIMPRGKPLCDAPLMTYGNKPADGGNLILSQTERDELIKKDPKIASCVRRYIGAKDFIRSDEVRYCLWLKDVSPNVYSHNREIMRRLEEVRKMRATSTASPTRAAAEWPYKFFSITQSDEPCLCIPAASSSRRKYIPIKFLDKKFIASNANLIVHSADLYHFGVLISRVHMAWMRSVTGRLGDGYQYSAAVVYNNFVWPDVNAKQRAKIESTAQKILDVREKFPDSSLADLYDPLSMPEELLRAHKANDAAVIAAYGWDKNISEEEIVSELMKLYEKMAGV